MLTRPVAVILLVGALVGAPTLLAERAEFHLLRNGERVAGADVCFFQAASQNSPFDRYMVSDDVSCLPADSIIDVPLGDWNVFGVLEGAWITRNVILSSKAGPSVDTFKNLSITMVPAGVLSVHQDVQHSANTFMTVWVPNNDGGPELGSYIRPVPANEHALTVPAGTRVYPLLVKNGRPAAIGDPVTVSPGTTVVAPQVETRPTGSLVVAWLRLDPGQRPILKKAPELAPPKFALKKNGTTVFPLEQPRFAAAADGFLLIFRDVHPGSYDIVSSGDRWSSVKRPVEVPIGGRPVIQEEALPVTLSASATVVWRLPRQRPTSCASATAPEQEAAGHVKIELLSCPSPDASPDACTIETTVTERSDANTHLFGDLAPGYKRARLVTESGVITSNVGLVGIEKPSEILIDTSAHVVSGRLTIGGRPAQGAIVFAGGASTFSDDTGAYEELVAENPGMRPVRIKLCSEAREYIHVPEADVVAGAIYDIDIPESSVEVKVVDDSMSAVGGAEVTYGVVRDGEGDAAQFVTAAAATDEQGRSTISHIPPTQNVVICARKAGFERACAAAVKGGDVAGKSVSVTLKRLTGGHGRVVTEVPISMGSLFVVGPDGAVIERTPVSMNGEFTLRQPYVFSSVFVVTAANMPLFVAEPPADLNVSIPEGIVRSFAVHLQDRSHSGAPFTIGVGNTIVPRDAIVQHQMRRSLPLSVSADRDIVVMDVVQSQPLSVILSPRLAELPPNVEPAAVFSSPQFRSLLMVRPVPPTVDKVVF